MRELGGTPTSPHTGHQNFVVHVRVEKEFPDTQYLRREWIYENKEQKEWRVLQTQWADFLTDQREWTPFVAQWPVFIGSRQRKFLLEGWCLFRRKELHRSWGSFSKPDTWAQTLFRCPCCHLRRQRLDLDAIEFQKAFSHGKWETLLKSSADYQPCLKYGDISLTKVTYFEFSLSSDCTFQSG